MQTKICDTNAIPDGTRTNGCVNEFLEGAKCDNDNDWECASNKCSTRDSEHHEKCIILYV